MEKNIASEILSTLNEASTVIDKALGEAKHACPPESFRVCAKLLGNAMSDMFDHVMAPIYAEHQDLAPDWYRDGSPRGRPQIPELHLPRETQKELLAAFETAYQKIQSSLHGLSRLSNPVDIALYSQGLHQVSVALCRARVILLLA